MVLIFFSSVYKHIGLSQSHYLNNYKRRRDRHKRIMERFIVKAMKWWWSKL